MQLLDQLQRPLKLTNIPKRIVSLVPSQTELLVDLKLEDSLVGVTKFCVHPPELRNKKTIVGGTKQIDVEVLKSLKPDIILCNKEENTKAIVQTCEKIAPVHVSDIATIAENNEMIKAYGQMFNVDNKAQRIIDAINTNYFELQESVKNEQKLKVAYFIWRQPYMVVGNKTFINHLLKSAGFINVFQSIDRYPDITLDIKELQEVDYIFLSSEPFPFKPKLAQDIIQKFGKDKIKYVDGEYFSWYGSRLIEALKYIKTLRTSL